MKRFFYSVIIAVACTATANAQTTQLKGGIQCQIVKPGGGARIKTDDVISFNIIQRTDKDSVLFNSYAQGSPVTIKVQPSQNPSDLMEVFQLLSVNDSAIVKVPVDSIFKGHEAEIPPFFKKGGMVTYNLKVIKSQTLTQAIAERNEAIAKYKAAETAASDAYIKAKGLAVKATPSGLRYAITKLGTKPRPQSGDSVWVNYTGRLARTGEVFDTSVESEAKASGNFMEGRPYEPISFEVDRQRVIKGWDEGLLLLPEGSKATFIIPSALGYGDRGSPPKIGPFADLIFDVELVKVVHAKKPKVTGTGKKTVTAKKATAKKRTTVKKKN